MLYRFSLIAAERERDTEGGRMGGRGGFSRTLARISLFGKGLVRIHMPAVNGDVQALRAESQHSED